MFTSSTEERYIGNYIIIEGIIKFERIIHIYTNTMETGKNIKISVKLSTISMKKFQSARRILGSVSLILHHFDGGTYNLPSKL